MRQIASTIFHPVIKKPDRRPREKHLEDMFGHVSTRFYTHFTAQFEGEMFSVSVLRKVLK